MSRAHKAYRRRHDRVIVLSLRVAGTKRERHPSDCYAKEWSPRFSKDQNFKDDESWVDIKRKLNAVGDDFGIFLEDVEGSVPCFQVKEVQEFCQGIRLEDLVAGAGTAGQRRGAWLDDRCSVCVTYNPSAPIRDYGNPLTATSLYQFLKKKVCDSSPSSVEDRFNADETG